MQDDALRHPETEKLTTVQPCLITLQRLLVCVLDIFFNVTLLFPHSSSIFYCIPVMVTVMLFSLIVTHCKEKKAFFPLISAFFSSNNFLGKINMLVQDKSASLQAGSPIFWISISLLPPNHNFWQITAKWVSMSKDVWSVQKYFCTFGVLPVIYSK